MRVLQGMGGGISIKLFSSMTLNAGLGISVQLNIRNQTSDKVVRPSSMHLLITRHRQNNMLAGAVVGDSLRGLKQILQLLVCRHLVTMFTL